MFWINSAHQRINAWTADNESKVEALKTCVWLGVSLIVQKVAISYFRLHLHPAITIYNKKFSFLEISHFTTLGIIVAAFTYRFEISKNICRIWGMFGVINLIHEMCLTTFIHEMGHALTKCALYLPARNKNNSASPPMNPTIMIELFKGGETRTLKADLSLLGRQLGEDRAKFAVAAGGPAASVAFAMGMFGWASYQSDEITAGRFMLHGAVQLLSELRGAREGASNDYEVMKKLGGIRSKHVLGMMILLPTIQLMWIYRLQLISAQTQLKSLISGLFQSQNTEQQ